MEGKKSRINNIDLVDRISALPDFILGHILSFLPTDKAVATSILSKRWKLAWVTVHSLDFCNRMGENEKDMEEEKVVEFVRFVNRVLLVNGVGSLNKFSLTCFSVSISPQIISWINTAITRRVHDLCLSVGYVDMPASLFSCDSLRSLVLYGYISIYDTSAVCLPRLESLKINRVRFQSEEGCEKIISGCPILHSLELSIEDVGCDYDNDFTCIISSASLKHLEIYFVYRSKLKLKAASSLEYLRLRGSVSEIFVEKTLSSLIEVDFNIDFGEHDILNNSIVEAVRAFDCAKFLTLSADVMEALSCATIKLSTDFKRLVKLGTSIKCCHWSSLQDFIQSSNNLEVLTIVQDPDDDGNDLDHDDDGNDPDNDGNNHDHSNWTTPVEVPRCLSTSLKKVVLDGYSGYEDEREMMRYMLKHGSVLDVMQISCDRDKIREKIDLLKEIHEFPRKSPACKVKFFERT